MAIKASIVMVISSVVLMQSWFGTEQLSKAFNSVGRFLATLFALYIVSYYVLPWIDCRIKSSKQGEIFLLTLLVSNTLISYVLYKIQEMTFSVTLFIVHHMEEFVLF